MTQHVYFFGNGRADGRVDMVSQLGDKGAQACGLVSLGLPVPPGFCITAECCDEYNRNNQEMPTWFKGKIMENVSEIETLLGKKLGGGVDPLVLSVRCSTAVAMPGMMPTVLNLGLNDECVKGCDDHLRWDLYQRFIKGYAAAVKHLDMEPFDEFLESKKRQLDAKDMLGRQHQDSDIPTVILQEIAEMFKTFYEEQAGEAFPQDPQVQLWEAIAAAFTSWKNPHAKQYRWKNKIDSFVGTAVVVEAMVFGTDVNSATGVAYFENPDTGAPGLYGEWLRQAQGDDLVGGGRQRSRLTRAGSQQWAAKSNISETLRLQEYSSLEEAMPTSFKELERVRHILEDHYPGIDFIKFTIQCGRVFILSSQLGRRVAPAQAKIKTPLPAPEEPPLPAQTGLQVGLPEKVQKWLKMLHDLAKPDEVHVCDGSKEEYDKLTAGLVQAGSFTPLNKEKRPNCFLCRSDPGDVARVEECTFICCAHEGDAGPTNYWYDPAAMKAELQGLFNGCMTGRTMYIIPFSMGPCDSPYARMGIQVTDSAYAVVNMHIMARVGAKPMQCIKDNIESGKDMPFIPCIHSVGFPLKLQDGTTRKDVQWPCNLANRYITHFPETREIWSFGSGYGGNALLGKKCFALRIASVLGRDEGWMAEHMLILKLTTPDGEVRHVTAAFPSACGKTNLAMLQPALPGWKVECIGDDIAWMQFGEDGRLYAINPEAGFFGVAPGTSDETNYNAMRSFDMNSLFTNVAMTDDGDVWWEGMTKNPPAHLIDWKGREWKPEDNTAAAHPNSRFTSPAKQCPTIAPEFEAPQGVPIDAILFGGRRDDTQPLVVQSHSWEHGTFLGATMASKKTAAAAGKVGELRFDPMAMLPFCGYNMADYFNHWLKVGADQKHHMPNIFYVNWFRKGKDGKFIWPGFSENIRVLKWVVDRCAGRAQGKDTPIGIVPRREDLDCTGLDLTDDQIEDMLAVRKDEWMACLPQIQQHLDKFGERMPAALRSQFDLLKSRLESMHVEPKQPKRNALVCARCSGVGWVVMNEDDMELSATCGAGPYPGTMECPECL